MLVLALLTSLLTPSASGIPWKITASNLEEREVTFVAQTTLGPEIEGNLTNEKDLASDLAIQGGTLSGKAQVQLKALDTGIELRNDHLQKKYFESQKWPLAQIKITPLSLPGNFETSTEYEKEKIPFEGRLVLHNQMSTIRGTVSVEKSNGKISLEFKFPISLAAHKIPTPLHLGVRVVDPVQVTVRLKAKLK